MVLIKYKQFFPKVHESAYIADGAIIAADVTVQDNVSIWFNSVVRGDVAPITIGRNTNVQDGVVIHTSRFDGSTIIGSDITIGHMALLHACIIEDNAFIGMQSIIMDKAVIEEYGFVAAGSLVPPGMVVKKYELWMGRPAKFVRMINEQEKEFMKENIKHYVDLANEYKRNQKKA